MSVNDTEVRRIIQEAMNAVPGDPSDTCCGRVRQAFRRLQARRQQPGQSLDLELAAAEHNLFARWMVCSGNVSTFQMHLLVDGYSLKKIIDRMRGDPNAEAVTDNPVSPPDPGVHMWGRLGVIEGGRDHDRCNSGTSAPLWRPIEEILGTSVGPY